LGFFMEGFKPQLRGVIVPLHISSGLTALMLTGFRVAWRLAHRKR
jgi:cytochrome b561